MSVYFDRSIAEANGPVAWTGHDAPLEEPQPWHDDVRVWYLNRWWSYRDWLRIAPISNDTQGIAASHSPLTEKRAQGDETRPKNLRKKFETDLAFDFDAG